MVDFAWYFGVVFSWTAKHWWRHRKRWGYPTLAISFLCFVFASWIHRYVLAVLPHPGADIGRSASGLWLNGVYLFISLGALAALSFAGIFLYAPCKVWRAQRDEIEAREEERDKAIRVAQALQSRSRSDLHWVASARCAFEWPSKHDGTKPIECQVKLPRRRNGQYLTVCRQTAGVNAYEFRTGDHRPDGFKVEIRIADASRAVVGEAAGFEWTATGLTA